MSDELATQIKVAATLVSGYADYAKAEEFSDSETKAMVRLSAIMTAVTADENMAGAVTFTLLSALWEFAPEGDALNLWFRRALAEAEAEPEDG